MQTRISEDKQGLKMLKKIPDNILFMFWVKIFVFKLNYHQLK